MSDNIIRLNEQVIRAGLTDLVKQSIEKTLNSPLDQEAEELTHAAKYERTNARKGYRTLITHAISRQLPAISP